MAKSVRKREARKRGQKEERLPLDKQNFLIIGAGLVVILAGYLAMGEGSVEGFIPLVVAPVLLVLGYCVIIPLGILFRRSSARAEPAEPEEAAKAGT